MRFEDAELKTTFTVPDAPTVRQVLAYDSAVEMLVGKPTYERLWHGVIVLAQDWQSERVKLELAALDQTAGAEIIQVIKWAGLCCFSFILELKQTPKNL